MAEIDKLVKVGQLDTIVDEIVGKFSESNDRTRWYSLTANVTDGSYVVGSTGGIGTNANLSYTEVSMLPFRGKGITIQSYLWQGAGYAFLDENGAYITGESANTQGITPAAGVVTKIETSVPYNAYVLRVSLHRNTYSAKAKKYFFTIGESKATKVVFIGDSYGTGYNTGGSTTGWVPGAASALGLKSSDFEKQAKGGAGFRHPANTSPNETFTDLLNTATLAKEDVGRIIVCGGYNDHIYTVSQLLESFGTFATKAREKYPFAEICVGMVGHTGDASVQETIMNTTRQAYMQMANVPGVRYLSNVECTLTDENVASDQVHPNQAGATALGTAVGNAVKTGSTSGKVYDSEIADINGRLQEFYTLVQFATPSSWELGYINSSSGGNGGSTVTCRNPIRDGVTIHKDTTIAVSVAEGYTCAVYEYLNNKSTFVKRAVDFTANYLEFTSAGGNYYRFCLKKADDSAIVIDDIPENVITLSYKNRTDDTLTMPDFPADSKTVGESLVVKSSNVLNPATLSANTYINAYGGESANSSYATTDYIPVETGDVVLVTAGDNTQRLIVTAVAYNESKVRIAGTATESYSYTVPNNARFVRICLNQTILTNTTRINIKGSREIYEPYYTGKVSEYVEKNRTDIFRMLSLPVNTLPSYVKNGLIYKPLGSLTKGYICFTSDDGNTGDATYTIPTFINKNVPCTLALFKGSQILQTQEGINLVKDAVENHGFCVAQHSGSYWLEWNEYQLTKFFDSEKDYFDSIGIDIYGAVNPGMESTDICRIVAGNRFGTFRTDYTAGVPYYDRYIAGPRSNMNSLPSQNLVDLGLDSWKDKCNLTLANHWLMMIHFHGNQIDQSALTLLESVIDYAISIGLEFITQKDIPTLI